FTGWSTWDESDAAMVRRGGTCFATSNRRTCSLKRFWSLHGRNTCVSTIGLHRAIARLRNGSTSNSKRSRWWNISSRQSCRESPGLAGTLETLTPGRGHRVGVTALGEPRRAHVADVLRQRADDLVAKIGVALDEPRDRACGHAEQVVPDEDLSIAGHAGTD